MAENLDVVYPESMIQEEVGKIRLLQGLVTDPEQFLAAQNELLYDRDLSHLRQDGDLDERGLPMDAADTYQPGRNVVPRVSERLPRVLNIGAGPEESQKMPAINIDISPHGKPEVMADAQHLPFASGSFSVVRASHVLEHIPQDQIVPTLLEWKRVLHQDGVLNIAVPDAEVTFQEIVDGQTPKGAPAYSLEGSTPPLAQIYGLGYEDPNTDERWKRTVIFSYPLLEHFLKEAGFTNIEKRTAEDDLAYHSGIDDDSQNHYTLLVSATDERTPHTVDAPMPERAFREKCQTFNEKYPDAEPATFIVPVHNEENNLAHFLTFLESASHRIEAPREFVFVINGCTDKSEEILRHYLGQTHLDARVVTSDKGIMVAFQKGIEERKYKGPVGKLDADTILHPHALDLMQMFLAESPEVGVTYSEPLPLNAKTEFNAVDYTPELRSRRLFHHGRASLYREDPFDQLADRELPKALRAEDYFLSFYFTYFRGLGSMVRTPHAMVYGKSVQNFDDLATQVARTGAEIDRVTQVFPPFNILRKLLRREIFSPEYKKLVADAEQVEIDTTGEYARLSSTK